MKANSTKLLTRKEAAELLNISIPTLNKYMNKGIINPVKIGNSIRFENDLNKLINQTKKK